MSPLQTVFREGSPVTLELEDKMRLGKLSEPVRKRSVLRQLNKDRTQAEKLYGSDCVFLDAGTGYQTVIASPDGIPGCEINLQYMVIAAMNSLLAAGAKPQMLLVQGVLPVTYEEAALQRDMKAAAAEAEGFEVPVCPGQIEVSDTVQEPRYFVNGIGQICETELWKRPEFRPGQELVLTRWIALGGTAMLAVSHEEELRTRYPFSLIDKAKEFEKLMSAASDARAITHFGTAAMHALAQGGIFGALWEMAEHAGVGLEVDLKKIPVRQETIEICEYFDRNPYELYSAGSLLVGTDKGEALTAYLQTRGIPAAVIGRVTDGNERIIRNGEDCRFLDRPKQDEGYRSAAER